MRQLKLLLAAIALLWAMPCWGKPIDLHGKCGERVTAPWVRIPVFPLDY